MRTVPNKITMKLPYLAMLTLVCASHSATAAEEVQLQAPPINLEVHEGLEAHLFASEPMIKAPTQVEVDHRGRVWVLEGRNYRKVRDKKGDRLMILEDTNGDGKADKSKVFYQGNDINAAMGMTVLGNKVIISNAPDIFILEDTDGDDVSDKKTYLFRGIGGKQHDHSVHTVVKGPDGKLYFGMGDHARGLKGADGKPIKDRYGKDPFKLPNGKVYRCDVDGSELEVIGWNFRNPYELAVDSYGGVWQSDNDDGGSPACRMNYLLEFGDYGYRSSVRSNGPRTGASPRPEVAHWNQNDGGVVPNLLLTGTGSPTGLLVYEGSTLPTEFQNQVIHCDHAQNVVRAYPVTTNGAGYKAEMINILRGDVSWFRPTDVCAAPDGSLFVSDWHDPASGGHRANSTETGRIYRVAPKGLKYRTQALAVVDASCAITALQSVNLDTREQGYQWLEKNVEASRKSLEVLYKNSNPRLAARAAWLLIKNNPSFAEMAASHSDEDIRVVALRAARCYSANLSAVLNKLSKDSSSHVRRECAIALRHYDGKDLNVIWSELASRHQAGDRWSIEALGIAADGRWDSLFADWLEKVGDWNTPAGRDIVWRARCPQAMKLYSEAIADKNYKLEDALRFFRAFDSYKNADSELKELLAVNHPEAEGITALAIKHMRAPKMSDPTVKLAVDKVLKNSVGSENYVTLVQRFSLKQHNPELLQIALKNAGRPLGAQALGALSKLGGIRLLKKYFEDGDLQQKENVISLAGFGRQEAAANILVPMLLSDSIDDAMKISIIKAVNNASSGARGVMPLIISNKFPEHLEAQALEILASCPYANVVDWAVGEIVKANGGREPLGINKLIVMNGDPHKGEVIAQSCLACHQVGEKGISFGPSLTSVGSKLGKFGLYDAILNPSAGIEFNYETTILKLKGGSELRGFVANENAQAIDLKVMGGGIETVKKAEVVSRRHSKKSMMPEVYGKSFSPQQLADLVSYLEQLK